MDETSTTLDVQISGPSDLNNLWKLIHIVFPSWSIENVQIQVLENGLSNTVIRLDNYDKSTNPQIALIRIYGELSSSIVVKGNEIRWMSLLHKLGNPQHVYQAFRNGMVYSFIEGETISVDEMSIMPYRLLIIKQLARLHCLPIIKELVSGQPIELKDAIVRKCHTPVLLPTIRKWIHKLPIKFDEPTKTERYKNEVPPTTTLLKEVDFLERLLSNCISPVVLCHDDLLPGNIIVSPDKNSVYFIDFEYCSFNHAAFDIGNHFCEYAGVNPVDFSKFPTLEFQREWISQYLSVCRQYAHSNKPNNSVSTTNHHNNIMIENSNATNNGDIDDDPEWNSKISLENLDAWLKEVNYFALAAHLYWGVWAILRTVEDQHKFDYLSYAILRLQQYTEMKQQITSIFNDSFIP